MINAVGVIEMKSIAKGIEACDSALKSADVRMISAHASCPGKYEMLLTGEISAVRAAMDQVKERYAHYVLRIPSDRFSEFLESSGELGNVTGSAGREHRPPLLRHAVAP